MNISGKTTVCGLIGDPVEHSMSPAMHDLAFRELGIDYVYVAFRVKADDVGNAIAGMRALRIRGLNVTIPHKLAVAPFLDKLDDLAKKIGAVNTIVNDSGVLTGYNTDAAGFLQPLLERGFEPRDKKIVVLGAGGAARGITFALADRGASIKILNRTASRAQELANQLSESFPGHAEGLELTERSLSVALSGAQMIVNTTSVGMGEDQNQTPIPARLLSRDALVYDIVYNPLRTRLVSEAEERGCTTISRAEMLAWQGALAFEKWTLRRAPVDLMKRELLRQLTHEN